MDNQASLTYKVIRPPLADTFPIPGDELLLKQKPGDLVKLVFQVGGENPERMWVVLTDTSSREQWQGSVNNDATQPLTRKYLPDGKEVSFHPRDVIKVWITPKE